MYFVSGGATGVIDRGFFFRPVRRFIWKTTGVKSLDKYEGISLGRYNTGN